MKKNKKGSLVASVKGNDTTLAGRYFYVNGISLILFLLLALYLTAIHNKVFLFKLQDLSLFLPTKMFFINTVRIPGGFLSYLGLFFTQFFYYPWLGSFFFIFFLFVTQFLTLKAFNLHHKYYPLSFIPSLLLLLALSQLGYYIYKLYSNGYVFSHIFGIIFVLGVFWIYREIEKQKLRLLFLFLFIPVFFHMSGFYSLFAVWLFVMFEIATLKKYNKKDQLIRIVLSLIFIFGIPILFYRYIYVVSKFPEIYIAAFPSYRITDDLALYLPFLILFIFLICIVFRFLPSTKTQKSFRLSFYIPALVFFMTLVGVFYFSYDDENFRTELAMERAVYNNNWKEVLTFRRKLKGEPTRLIIMDTYLALRKLHIAGDKMFTFKNGNKQLNSRKPVLPIEIAGKMFFFQYGKINYCYRWCMENMMNNGMNIDDLKYFVKSCLLNEEYSLAKKYNDVLLKTLFHKSWARKYQEYIENPEKIHLDTEFREIMPLLSFENDLYAEDKSKFEEYLRYSFATVNFGSQEIMDLSIQSVLEYKNMNAFWPRLAYYLLTHSRLPVHYQEAALLYYSLKRDVDISEVNIDKNVLNNFREFILAKNKYTKLSADQAKPFFTERFGNTYWYYYYFV
jgi:hypothetical protein